VTIVLAVPETVPVPAVVGMTLEDARQALRGGRLAVGSEDVRETRTERAGVVLAQNREGGTAAAVGTAIDLIVATPAMVVVPNVVGLSNADAAAAIADGGLTIGNVGTQFSMQPGGTVLAQGQPPNTVVAFTTPIGLQVALPRMLWVAPASLLFVVGMLTLGRRVRLARRSKQTNAHAAQPLLRVTPVVDSGMHQVTSALTPLISLEMRLKPIVDSGVQDLRPDHGVVMRERRHHG
jgi:hypothetical protein